MARGAIAIAKHWLCLSCMCGVRQAAGTSLPQVRDMQATRVVRTAHQQAGEDDGHPGGSEQDDRADEAPAARRVLRYHQHVDHVQRRRQACARVGQPPALPFARWRAGDTCVIIASRPPGRSRLQVLPCIRMLAAAHELSHRPSTPWRMRDREQTSKMRRGSAGWGA